MNEIKKDSEIKNDINVAILFVDGSAGLTKDLICIKKIFY